MGAGAFRLPRRGRARLRVIGIGAVISIATVSLLMGVAFAHHSDLSGETVCTSGDHEIKDRNNGERHEMQDRSFVTVIDERPDLKRLRRRPFDRAGAKMRRHLPIDCRRQPRIAGIAPIGMPTILDLEAQRDGSRPARNDRGAFGDELGFDVGRLDRRGAHERRLREQRERATE